MDILRRLFLLFFDERQWFKLIGIVNELFAGNIYNQVAILALALFFIILVILNFVKKENKEYLIKAAIFCYMFFLIFFMVLGRPSGERRFVTWNIEMFYSNNVFHETSIILTIVKMTIFIPIGFFVGRIYEKEIWQKSVRSIVLIPLLTESFKYLLGKGVPSTGGILVHIIGGLIGFLLGILFSKLKA